MSDAFYSVGAVGALQCWPWVQFFSCAALTWEWLPPAFSSLNLDPVPSILLPLPQLRGHVRPPPRSRRLNGSGAEEGGDAAAATPAAAAGEGPEATRAVAEAIQVGREGLCGHWQAARK